jgi:molybdopterin molybdotransferase
VISVEDHLRRILDAVRALDAVRLPVDDALGRTLREDVRSHVDLPLFDNSAMDGFAVRFADIEGAAADRPVTLEVVADLPAGTGDDPRLLAGQAARIMTGAPLPSDADTVVPFEETTGGLADSLSRVEVTAATTAGANTRRRGEEHAAGDVVLTAGVRLGARQLAAAAAAGVAQLTVSRLPRVAVISTGDELRAAGSALERGQIPESNGVLVAGLCATEGAEVVLRGIVSDDGDGLRAALQTASDRGADLVITTGGVSAGAYEVVKNVAPMLFDKVAMQPGKPQGFGAGHPLLFGLPGNPVSAAVSFEVFVRPALLAMQGRADLARRTVRLPALEGWRTPAGRRQYLPVVLEASGVRPASSGGSHLVASLGRADAYAVVPADIAAVAPGDVVDVMLVT